MRNKIFPALDKFPLFGLQPPKEHSLGKKAGFWLWNLLWLVLAAAGLTACSLLLAIGPYSYGVFLGYLECPLIFLLNFLPVLLLLLLLWFATGRSWLSFLLTAAVIVGGSLGNYYKLYFRNDPVIFSDLLILREAGKMTGSYPLFLSFPVVFSLLAVAAGTVFLALLVRGRPRPWWTRLGGAAAVVLVCALLTNTYLSDSVYAKTAHYDHLSSQWSPTQQYLARGFVYPFLHSISDALVQPPEGYDESEMEALLGQYEDADIPEEQKVNVVAIMLEAFADFSDCEAVQFNQDPYELYHALAAESYTGSLLTNIFAGGTVDSERAFLTGYIQTDSYRTNTNSYVWYFRSQGYHTSGDHPCYDWFYNRVNVNSYLGFEEYRFVENFYGEMTGGQVGYDDLFFPQLLASVQEQMEQDEPLFSFSVTYQGHGPYSTTYATWSQLGDYVSLEAGYSSETAYILENYFASVANTWENLTAFVDALRDSDEPVVLILFGDHKPWLGDGNSVYTELGISLDVSTVEGFRNYYETPYLIWANDAAKEALGFGFTGEGPDLGPYFLMSHFFDLCGWDGPAFMQATREMAAVNPVCSVSGWYLKEDGLVAVLPGEEAALVQCYKYLQYYQSRNFQYRSVLE